MCRTPRRCVWNANTIEKKISGLQFRGLAQDRAELGHQWGGDYLHGFAAGSCYEVGYGIATAGYGAVDGMRKVHDDELSTILDGILKTLTIHRDRSVRIPSDRLQFESSALLRCLTP
jgi:hypothetical protein